MIAEEADGDKVGKEMEKHTNLKDGVSKGGELSNVMHEKPTTNLRKDHRAPATIDKRIPKEVYQQQSGHSQINIRLQQNEGLKSGNEMECSSTGNQRSDGTSVTI